MHRAVSGPRIAWSDTDDTAWNAASEINLTAHHRTCRAVTPAMIDRRWGRIVNVSSVNARTGRAGLTA
ncbi:SDR family NAD(P)-dependent oxidoreductase [Kitasatospora griseola]|uniref:SDR family NAD(P)-dependent oxidoreductase n=1 Tax=Kitasatospora griseola TaxID=2064 RepID=UPI0037F96556